MSKIGLIDVIHFQCHSEWHTLQNVYGLDSWKCFKEIIKVNKRWLKHPSAAFYNNLVELGFLVEGHDECKRRFMFSAGVENDAGHLVSTQEGRTWLLRFFYFLTLLFTEFESVKAPLKLLCTLILLQLWLTLCESQSDCKYKDSVHFTIYAVDCEHVAYIYIYIYKML